jgi:dsRNA-specific ribonuclease
MLWCSQMASPELPPGPVETLRADAWQGDAVLELYVRSWILQRYGLINAEMKTRFTCNQFLNNIGNPTRVEAAIGQIYQRKGLDEAFRWIAQHLEPLFVKQEDNRERKIRH